MIGDPVVEEVRAARETILKRFDYDIHALLRDAQQRESIQRQHFVSFDETAKPKSKPPAAG